MKTVKSVFFDSNGNPTLQLSYCAFMDIIGFKEMIEELKTTTESESILKRLHKLISNQLRELSKKEDEDFPADWFIKVFTDNIVLGQMIHSGEAESSEAEWEWGYIVMASMELQLALALEGFFLKGGISVGELFIDDSMVFGPALLEAYRIEQSVARDPRIVLSDSVLELARNHVTFYRKPEVAPQYEEILIDSDGKAFVNYLTLLFDDAEDLEYFSDSWKGLEKHKKNIESGLIKYREKPEIWSKYYWLANYHNYFCRQFIHFPGYDKKYKINSKLLAKKIFKITHRPKSD